MTPSAYLRHAGLYQNWYYDICIPGSSASLRDSTDPGPAANLFENG
ncbi:hypothetical protein SBA4_220051 [Candidatus Sulfopaludibacter sp. SbA4]|nr:hypothetical protein SBA4_220051 [Candidatus Sulfopaludibacter sp. SbA4]